MPDLEPWYRVYFIGSDGYIVRRCDVECRDDAEACAEVLSG